LDEKKQALLQAVKKTAARYGIAGVSTRLIGEATGVNDAYIYRYFNKVTSKNSNHPLEKLPKYSKI